MFWTILFCYLGLLLGQAACIPSLLRPQPGLRSQLRNGAHGRTARDIVLNSWRVPIDPLQSVSSKAFILFRFTMTREQSGLLSNLAVKRHGAWRGRSSLTSLSVLDPQSSLCRKLLLSRLLGIQAQHIDSQTKLSRLETSENLKARIHRLVLVPPSEVLQNRLQKRESIGLNDNQKQNLQFSPWQASLTENWS